VRRVRLGPPGRVGGVALLAIGLAWGLWAVGTAFDEAQVPTEAELGADLAVGLLMQWVGLVVWRRPGTGRTGPLLYLAGLLWYVGSVWDAPPVGAVTFAWRSWYDPVILAVVLGWSTAHLRRPIDRLLVGTLAGAYLVRSLTRMFVFDGGQYFDDVAWHNPLSIRWNQGLWETVENATIVVSALVGLAVAVTCLVRWRRASGPARRTLTPILAAGVAMVPLLGWTAFTNQFSGFLPDLSGLPVFWAQMILRGFIPIAILIGLYRLHTNRALADFLLELDRGVPVGSLQEVMARVLGDPGLRLAFALPGGGYIDGIGRPLELPTDASGVSVAAIEDDHGVPLAFIIHDPALDEDPDLVRAAGAAARLSLTNERLQAEVRAQLDEVRASRARLVEGSDSERRRVERDLHDGAQQRLVTLALQLRQARDRASDPDPELTALLDEASKELDLALIELRELARGIHPAVLSRSGLGPAVETLAQRCPIPVSVSASTGRCPAAVELTAYFLVAESLTNVVRYSAAGSARIVAEHRNGELIVEIIDDGVGGANPRAGSGLRGLEDRVLAVGGRFQLESPSGVGTTVRATLPCG
jgi:signal transduction histidine kinase